MIPMLPIAGILLLAVGLLSSEGPPAEAQQPPGPILESPQVVDTEPVRPQSSVALASGVLRAAVERLQQGQTTGLGVDVVGTEIRVEVLHSLDSSEIRAVIAGLGGTVEGEVEGVLVEALVPFDKLEALESHAGVQFVRPPLDANVPIPLPSGGQVAPLSVTATEGEEVVKTNADDWHAIGFTGAGVKVGIIDYFDGTLWNNAAAAGELPATAAGTFCRCGGVNEDIWDGWGKHGQAVAEVVYEMAPGAELYLATVCTTTDLQDAVDYFDAQGVAVITRSLTAQYDGPGDGTGPIADVINNAVADGMVWFNSAGNNAGDATYYGSYWRGQWADANDNDWLDFAPGVEFMPIWCSYANGVRWSDFGSPNPTDYDACVFDEPDQETIIACSADWQPPALPLETAIPCRSEWDYLAIPLYSENNGTAGDVLEFMTNGGAVYYWQNPYSASGPASDTASPGALSIGAIDPALGTAIAWYSSRGPTNDALYGGTARIKPDVSAASCVASFTYSPDCFNGTSASTPAAAGAAALLIEAGVATTPSQVKTYLLTNAAVDRGAPGPDNDFGAGEILLPQPPGACDPSLDTDSDGFGNDDECYLGTDPLDACRDDPSDDAWPLDVSMDGQLSVVGDVLNFRGVIGATPGAPGWWQRLDYNGDGQLSVVGDVLLYRGRIGDTCT